jgi:hypothetical protein
LRAFAEGFGIAVPAEPELLAASKAMLAQLKKSLCPGEVARAFDTLRAAVAKAERGIA